MPVRDWLRKHQRSNWFLAAWGVACLTIWAIIRRFASLVGERGAWLIDGAQIAALNAINFIVVVYMARFAILNRRRPKGERKKYSSVSADEVVDLYLQLLATSGVTSVVVTLGLLALQHFHWLYSPYPLIVLVMGWISGVGIVAVRSLQRYSLD